MSDTKIITARKLDFFSRITRLGIYSWISRYHEKKTMLYSHLVKLLCSRTQFWGFQIYKNVYSPHCRLISI